MHNHYKIMLCMIIIILGCNLNHGKGKKVGLICKSPIERIHDSSIALADKIKILKSTTPDSIRPKDLSEIINDSSYSPILRRKCLFYLFTKYFTPPISLDSLLQVVGKLNWLKAENTEWVYVEMGKLIFQRNMAAQHVVIIPKMPNDNYSAIHLEIIFSKAIKEKDKILPRNKFLLKVFKDDVPRSTLKNIIVYRIVIVEDGKIIFQ